MPTVVEIDRLRAESAGLDVERLARAILAVSIAEPGLLADVDMLNDPTEGDPRPAAKSIVAEYARLAEDADKPRDSDAPR